MVFYLFCNFNPRGQERAFVGPLWRALARIFSVFLRIFCFFSELQPFFIMLETTTGDGKCAHMPIIPKTDSKGIKMTALAAPNQMLC